MKISTKRRFVIFMKKKSTVRDLVFSKIEKVISFPFPLSESSGDLRRFIAINCIKRSRFAEINPLPEIEVFIPSVGKDLFLIRAVVEKAIEKSLNPVIQVSVCVPEKEVECFKKELDQKNNAPIRIISEESILSPSLLGKIRSEFGSRSGWVIAEFLKIEYSTKSEFAGVLVVDSDTIILRDRVWLSASRMQNLFPVQEYHSEYFRLLSKLGLANSPSKFSFMSHYMLFQPMIYRDMYEVIARLNPDELLNKIISNKRQDSKSPFCICYEAYASHLMSKLPHLVQIEKWSNVGFKREIFTLDFKVNLEYLETRKLDSVSLHSYL